MATTKTGNQKEATRKARLYNLRNIAHIVAKEATNAGVNPELYKRQVEDTSDPFSTYYSANLLVEPPYAFSSLSKIYEDSDVLQECIDAMIQNIDGFGYQLQFKGDDLKESSLPEAQKSKLRAKSFFDGVNDTQSMLTIRKAMRQDLEEFGNGAFEVVRNRMGMIQLLFHMPFKQLRISSVDPDPVEVPITVTRDGKPISFPVKKQFRKFAQISTTTGQELRWFKSFGDPRTLDATTGKFIMKGDEPPAIVASEILHFRYPIGHSVYGIPRWMGIVLDIIGRRSSQFVNYDLFENQGIAPMVVMVSGGTLTDDSLEELEILMRSMRGVEKWNRVWLLEANPESQGLDDKGNAKIELKNMSDYRKEDQMFSKYLEDTEKTIRHRYRLPDLFVGQSESFTHATAKSAKEIAEEQVFIPERSDFDEIVDKLLMPQIGVTDWSYISKGPQIVGSEEISSGVNAFAASAAFTINHSIEMANKAFGLQMSQFEAPWADYPWPIVKALVDRDRLDGLDDIMRVVPLPNNQTLNENPPDDTTGSDKFKPELNNKDLKGAILEACKSLIDSKLVTDKQELAHIKVIQKTVANAVLTEDTMQALATKKDQPKSKGQSHNKTGKKEK